MDTLRLRSSARHLATSRAVVVCGVFLVLLGPLLAGLLVAGRYSAWPELFLVATAAPGVGIAAAVFMLVVRLWRRSRPVLLIDDHVTLPATGIRFPLSRLNRVQLYTHGGVARMVLLPEHVIERVPSRAVDPYTVSFPAGANYLPNELLDLVGRRVSGVGVDKLGSL
ncbi:hypothetical protein [Corynebacterium nasicanis]|uniref:PH domain-containing protein n=1 Tax=Corynebacterium nasicanis TaxID=1448267 RepID=A0ABW1Q9L0_9CORY